MWGPGGCGGLLGALGSFRSGADRTGQLSGHLALPQPWEAFRDYSPPRQEKASSICHFQGITWGYEP